MGCPSSNSTCPRAFFTMTRSIRSSSGVHVATVSFPRVLSTRLAASIRLRNQGLRARIREAVGNCRGSGSVDAGDDRREERSKVLFVLRESGVTLQTHSHVHEILRIRRVQQCFGWNVISTIMSAVIAVGTRYAIHAAKLIAEVVDLFHGVSSFFPQLGLMSQLAMNSSFK